jgi:hypothetical protein
MAADLQPHGPPEVRPAHSLRPHIQPGQRPRSPNSLGERRSLFSWRRHERSRLGARAAVEPASVPHRLGDIHPASGSATLDVAGVLGDGAPRAAQPFARPTASRHALLVPETALTQTEAESPDFWRNLRPELSIEASSPRPAFEIDDVEDLIEILRYDGYVNVPGLVPEPEIRPLRACIDCLHERRIPVVFAFVYDEFWRAFQGLAPFLQAALGGSYRALPDFWVWRVEPSDSESGWEPHRDCADPTVDKDNSPHSLTVWLALSDATPLNGCVYVLPAYLDDRFGRRVWDGDEELFVEDLQNVRALPALSGSMLAWNQNLLHWGGRASRRARAPRVSAAFEFQRSDKPPFNEPLLDASPAPPFRERLGLIGKQVLQYQHMYPLTRDLRRIAESLHGRYMPGSTADA